ncbi:MAG TPA: DEAD/DEAH box helicase [Verrucomicrobiae bacterium]|nr:DEAD/DEAH box helicase [Verrucomicrobiae bacterium]
MSEAFSRLDRKIQEAIWDLRWNELWPLQVEAIGAVLDGDGDIILAAATSGGKTEAAFLPILSLLVGDPGGSVGALYVSPLKALINDQFRRLEDLCESADIPVHRWHGDVGAAQKAKLRRHPSGVLLITPESLESQFVNYGEHLARVYSRLRFVVIDELHAFLDDVRGMHLRSLLARLEIISGATPRRLGLSATIGDFAPARQFLRPDDPGRVRVIRAEGEGRDLKVGVRAHLEGSDPNDGDGDGEVDTVAAQPSPIGPGAAANAGHTPTPDGLGEIASDIASRFRDETNLVFCNSRRQVELLGDKLRQISERESWPRNPFLLHHGSLSRELREDAEAELKSGKPVTAICTSTLEMGIDIGSVRAIGQVGPTWSVASLVQRLGRSGRKEGEARILRLYTLDRLPNESSTLTDRLYPRLVRAVALVDLMLEGWLEPPLAPRFHFSTCVHQILSLLRQTGGAAADHIYDVLCHRGAFRLIDRPRFASLLRGIASAGLIEQVPTGELILAPGGERIVESYDFYAAFAGRIEYRVECDGQPIGLLPEDSIPGQGEFLLLGGRRWKVLWIDHSTRRIGVVPGKGWKQPKFSGGVGFMHPVVAARMRQVLADSGIPPYLGKSGCDLLATARGNFARSGLGSSDVLSGTSFIQWFPWRGGRALLTLELCAKADEIDVDRDDLRLQYKKISAEDFEEHRRRVATGTFDAARLAELADEPARDRFDPYVPDSLLREAFAAEVLDVDGAREAAGDTPHTSGK